MILMGFFGNEINEQLINEIIEHESSNDFVGFLRNELHIGVQESNTQLQQRIIKLVPIITKYKTLLERCCLLPHIEKY